MRRSKKQEKDKDRIRVEYNEIQLKRVCVETDNTDQHVELSTVKSNSDSWTCCFTASPTVVAIDRKYDYNHYLSRIFGRCFIISRIAYAFPNSNIRWNTIYYAKIIEETKNVLFIRNLYFTQIGRLYFAIICISCELISTILFSWQVIYQKFIDMVFCGEKLEEVYILKFFVANKERNAQQIRHPKVMITQLTEINHVRRIKLLAEK